MNEFFVSFRPYTDFTDTEPLFLLSSFLVAPRSNSRYFHLPPTRLFSISSAFAFAASLNWLIASAFKVFDWSEDWPIFFILFANFETQDFLSAIAADVSMVVQINVKIDNFNFIWNSFIGAKAIFQNL